MLFATFDQAQQHSQITHPVFDHTRIAGPIADRLNDYGVPAYAYRNLSWDALRAEIAAGRPAEAWIAAGAPYYPKYYSPNGSATVVSPYEHTVIVIGYTPKQVYILNGSKKYWQGVDEFLASWSALRNMAILNHP